MQLALETAAVTADGTAYTGKGDFYGFSCEAGNAVIHDGTSTSGAVIAAAAAPGIILDGNYTQFETGIHVNLSSASNVVVYFTRR